MGQAIPVFRTLKCLRGPSCAQGFGYRSDFTCPGHFFLRDRFQDIGDPWYRFNKDFLLHIVQGFPYGCLRGPNFFGDPCFYNNGFKPEGLFPKLRNGGLLNT